MFEYDGFPHAWVFIYIYIYVCVCVCMDGYYNGVYVIHIARISVYMLTHAYIHTYNIFT